MGIELNNQQIYALYEGETWFHKGTKQVFEISGPSGSGKSSIIMYLIERLGLELDEVLFLAYMGKAAYRLALLGLPARTIHSAIYDYKKVIMRDEDGKIIFDEKGRPKKEGKFVLKDRIGKGKTKLIVVDEGSMVNEKIGMDLLSFGIPVVVLGDLNQLPPVFGDPFFLKKPDVILTQIMRQKEGDPIIYLSQQVLAGRELEVGVYGKSEVIPRSSIKEFHFTKADMVLTETNRLRWNINNYFREEIRQYKQLDYPHIGEKVICRKNNWKKSIDDGVFMTNGMTGYVDDVFKNTFDKKSMVMDFRPDFTNSVFKNIRFNYPYMYAIPTSALSEENNSSLDKALNDIYIDRFEYSYAITTHLSQGSQYNKVLFLNERMMRTKEDQIKLAYTAITRAIDSISIVV